MHLIIFMLFLQTSLSTMVLLTTFIFSTISLIPKHIIIFHRLHLALRCYQEFLYSVQFMSHSEDVGLKNSAKVLLS